MKNHFQKILIFVLLLSVSIKHSIAESMIKEIQYLTVKDVQSSEEVLDRFQINPPFFEVEESIKENIQREVGLFLKESNFPERSGVKFHMQVFGYTKWFFRKELIVIAVCEDGISGLMMSQGSLNTKDFLKRPVLVYDGERCFSYGRFNTSGEYAGLKFRRSSSK